ncbi:MAG: GGDEF domain-containing protein [Spirulina sp. DLM2.Bin59]|nr:MAG: GGDEF domain-containing protein [Spirulina sp. DLM2.Bin59]
MKSDIPIVVAGGRPFLARLEPYLQPWGAVSCESPTLDSLLKMLKPARASIVLLSPPLVEQDYVEPLKNQSHLTVVYCIAVNTTPLPRYNLAAILTEVGLLTQGADAYLELLPCPQTAALIAAEHQLFQAYLEVAKRYLAQHCHLMTANDFLSSIALADPLTTLSNRRALEWELTRQIRRAQTQGTPLSLLVLDVDFFKAVNDNHGHQAGDRILQLLAQRLRNYLRRQDAVFRYGGEEFVVLLKNTDNEAAGAIAQRLRALIGDHPFAVDRDLHLTITLSIGVATFHMGDDREGRSLFQRADQGLFEAKTNGRNQVMNADQRTG